jgi:UPF0755 protein
MKRIILAIVAACILGIALITWLTVREFTKPNPSPKAPVQAEDVQITIIEGWTLADVGEYLEKQDLASKEDFLTVAAEFDTSSYEIINTKPAKSSLEGFVFPDTYRIPKISKSATSSQATSSAVLRRALTNFESKYKQALASQTKKTDLSMFEIVTLASIIEKETGRNAVTEKQKENLRDERFTVAGIFYNRLTIGMALESDATVNYVTGKNTPAASLEDIQRDSPYNTYKYRGLPPGPIASPSLTSIEAALSPKETDYLFFLHKQPSGEVVYSKTHEEHVENKYRYLK